MSKVFISLLFAVLLLFFSTSVWAFEECSGIPRLTWAPNETKSFGDVKFETYEEKRHSGKDKKFVVSYRNRVLNIHSAKSCHRLFFNLWFANTGEKVEKPESIYLYFVSFSTYRKYGWKSKRRLKVFDGKKLIFSKNLSLDRHRRKPHPNSIENYREEISNDVSVEQLEQMANATNLAFYLGRTKVNITDKDINAIKEMVKFIDNIK